MAARNSDVSHMKSHGGNVTYMMWLLLEETAIQTLGAPTTIDRSGDFCRADNATYFEIPVRPPKKSDGHVEENTVDPRAV
jgi:hypothetical protein